jgi:hypothetical protein
MDAARRSSTCGVLQGRPCIQVSGSPPRVRLPVRSNTAAERSPLQIVHFWHSASQALIRPPVQAQPAAASLGGASPSSYLPFAPPSHTWPLFSSSREGMVDPPPALAPGFSVKNPAARARLTMSCKRELLAARGVPGRGGAADAVCEETGGGALRGTHAVPGFVGSGRGALSGGLGVRPARAVDPGGGGMLRNLGRAGVERSGSSPKTDLPAPVERGDGVVTTPSALPFASCPEAVVSPTGADRRAGCARGTPLPPCTVSDNSTGATGSASTGAARWTTPPLGTVDHRSRVATPAARSAGRSDLGSSRLWAAWPARWSPAAAACNGGGDEDTRSARYSAILA